MTKDVDEGARVSRLRTSLEELKARAARYEKVPVVGVLVQLYRRDRESAGPVVGSAVAFRLFLFFAPFLLFAVGVAGFLSGVVSAHDVNSSGGFSGGLATQIRGAFEQPGSSRVIATAVGFFGAVTAGRSLSKALSSASALAWRLPVTDKPSFRVVGSVVGLVCSIALIATLVHRLAQAAGLAVASVSLVAVFGAYFVAWLVISLLLPRATADPSALIPGAALVGLTITGMQAVSEFYLPGRFERASQLYGAIGTTLVTLGWFFILGRAIVLAMTLDSVLYERYGSVASIVFALPGLRLIPRHSRRVRRFFQLDEDA
jgi:uncharacterized BrkB/YihY/UPF0761 family membrane protein